MRIQTVLQLKTVYFIRHAKSSWENLRLPDIDRPLNPRGKRDAPFMANVLKEKQKPEFDALVSSPARRALTTARIFGDLFGLQPEVDRRIYEAWEGTIYEVIRSWDDDRQTVGIFGHNPTFTTLANRFSHEMIDNLPTCGIFKVVAEIDRWQDFGPDEGRLHAFYFPKQFKER